MQFSISTDEKHSLDQEEKGTQPARGRDNHPGPDSQMALPPLLSNVPPDMHAAPPGRARHRTKRPTVSTHGATLRTLGISLKLLEILSLPRLQDARSRLKKINAISQQ